MKDDHHFMQGHPVSNQNRIPRESWDRAPWNRWSFQNVRSIVPTVEVWRGSGSVWELPRNECDLLSVSFGTTSGSSSTIALWLDSSYTDGFIVLHCGEIAFECYQNGMHERTLHLSQSVSKSITASVTGLLVDCGIMDTTALVTEYAPELANTGWKGATIQHLLDMAGGTAYVEDYEASDSDIAVTDIASGWKLPPDGYAGPTCIWDQILGLKSADREHGSEFNYRSIETDLLANLMERASGKGLANLLSEELWSKIGAEESACFTVDSGGYPLADGGFNACLRDYARFGQMIANNGFANGQQVLPERWIAETRKGDPILFNNAAPDTTPNGAYHNQFWIRDHRKSILMAKGIFGQMIYTDPDTQIVVVKLSSWPESLSNHRTSDTLAAIDAITEFLI